MRFITCRHLILTISLVLSYLCSYCTTTSAIDRQNVSEVTENSPPLTGHAIQVGAFSKLENAVLLTTSLKNLGLDIYYFKDISGLYKVRFGNFPSRDMALAEAKNLQKNSIINDFFIVSEDHYTCKKEYTPVNTGGLRKAIVSTAKSFIGIPYRFGGETADEGFDCSGLTMVSYRINGLKLPRNSRQQWVAGRLIDKHDLSEADLLFFDTKGNGRVTHVGIYIGNGQFVHAPKSGKTIRIDSLSNNYYKKRYLGAKTYLDRKISLTKN